MTVYTDEQLNYALINSDYYHFLTVSSLRAILNALPKPQTDDGWQPCRFEDIRKGDRVKYETPDALIEPKHPVFRNFGDELAFVGGMKVLNHPDARWYRIPAPAVHPTPEAHPVIIVRGTEYGALDVATPMIHDGGVFYESPKGSYKADTITDWSPAKVVPDDE